MKVPTISNRRQCLKYNPRRIILFRLIGAQISSCCLGSALGDLLMRWSLEFLSFRAQGCSRFMGDLGFLKGFQLLALGIALKELK